MSFSTDVSQSSILRLTLGSEASKGLHQQHATGEISLFSSGMRMFLDEQLKREDLDGDVRKVLEWVESSFRICPEQSPLFSRLCEAFLLEHPRGPAFRNSSTCQFDYHDLGYLMTALAACTTDMDAAAAMLDTIYASSDPGFVFCNCENVLSRRELVDCLKHCFDALSKDLPELTKIWLSKRSDLSLSGARMLDGIEVAFDVLRQKVEKQSPSDKTQAPAFPGQSQSIFQQVSDHLRRSVDPASTPDLSPKAERRFADLSTLASNTETVSNTANAETPLSCPPQEQKTGSFQAVLNRSLSGTRASSLEKEQITESHSLQSGLRPASTAEYTAWLESYLSDPAHRVTFVNRPMKEGGILYAQSEDIDAPSEKNPTKRPLVIVPKEISLPDSAFGKVNQLLENGVVMGALGGDPLCFSDTIPENLKQRLLDFTILNFGTLRNEKRNCPPQIGPQSAPLFNLDHHLTVNLGLRPALYGDVQETYKNYLGQGGAPVGSIDLDPNLASLPLEDTFTSVFVATKDCVPPGLCGSSSICILVPPGITVEKTGHNDVISMECPRKNTNWDQFSLAYSDE